MKIFKTFLILALIAFPTIILHSNNGLSYAQEDEVLEDEANVAEEEEATDEGVAEEGVTGTDATDEEEEEDTTLKKSPDAATKILFVKPADSSNLPAGSLVHVVIGFTNNGKSDFVVNDMEASFRYPQDFNYFIQNFTAVGFGKTVEPSRQASFEYSFYPSENFNGRPFGLAINLNYQDAEGKLYQDAVFNETVMITDNDEGFDGETFFVYVTLAALALLIIVILQQTVFSSASKRLTSSKPKAPSSDSGSIDYDWIPKENLTPAQRRVSPRRRNRNSATASSGSGDEK